jgi:hypothetical protein
MAGAGGFAHPAHANMNIDYAVAGFAYLGYLAGLDMTLQADKASAVSSDGDGWHAECRTSRIAILASGQNQWQDHSYTIVKG